MNQRKKRRKLAATARNAVAEFQRIITPYQEGITLINEMAALPLSESDQVFLARGFAEIAATIRKTEVVAEIETAMVSLRALRDSMVEASNAPVN